MNRDPRMILSTSRPAQPAPASLPVWQALATAAAMLMVGAMMFV
jgi:hypothetical protein